MRLRTIMKSMIPIMKVLTSDIEEDDVYLLPDYKEYVSLPENKMKKIEEK